MSTGGEGRSPKTVIQVDETDWKNIACNRDGWDRNGFGGKNINGS